MQSTWMIKNKMAAPGKIQNYNNVIYDVGIKLSIRGRIKGIK